MFPNYIKGNVDKVENKVYISKLFSIIELLPISYRNFKCMGC